MTAYTAPTRDMRFVITELLDFASLTALPGFEELGPDVVESILTEAGKFSAQELAPLNRVGDTQPARWQDGEVTVSPGFAEAYHRFVEGGWNGVVADPAYGGMGLPQLLGSATQEMWQSANMAWGLCPMLTAGAIEALSQHGSEEQKATYLHKLVSGEWTGTMNLTEPQAGSDLAAVRTRAVRQDDGTYRISGQKIFITWGEHSVTKNIIHLVLARTPDAPPGVKGISLFIVPKFLVNPDGSLGARNDVRCVSIEHKLGIHGSPTCTMVFGDQGGAVGYLVGEEGRGLEYMFTMMNEARHKVGVQGIGVAERAYQHALAYARERVQGKPLGYTGQDKATIIHHPDVRRMLLTMKALTEAGRALAYLAGYHLDVAHRHPDAEQRRVHQSRVDLLIPVVKSWGTEIGVEVASLGVQVHGGMGFIEETGAAQYYRDARITPIYEGTNGIQANDLIGRKLLRDKGNAMNALLAELDALTAGLGQIGYQERLGEAVRLLRRATESVLADGDPARAQAISHHYLMLTAYTLGGALMARAALKAQAALDAGSDETSFYRAKLATARFYMDQILPRAQAHGLAILAGADAVLAPEVELF